MAYDQERTPFYKEALAKPIEEITEDIFLRTDAFEDAPWYDDFTLYTHIGVCQPKPEHIPEVQKALKMMGNPSTKTVEREGKIYLVPGESAIIKKEHNHER